ncbi:MAG: DegV family EDD domain-containing protein [Bacteroidales bacterium]|jgi:DegV family protein with EDD domain|nr:DegV family EDD domain-containing protein [Bacteroidales bacterium]
MITHISGKHLYYAFLAGAKRILEEQQYLNKINVFPVPDGDTGTNMASTVQAIVDNTLIHNGYKDTAMSIADAALVGARGNSGVIFAQFLFGTASDSPNNETISIDEFIQSVKAGVKAAYESISNPVEGTIITLLRKWAEVMEDLKSKTDDFIELLSLVYPALEEALRDTKKLLPKLAKAKVVDSGAHAFVFFIQGALEFLTTGTLKDLAGTRSQTIAEADEAHIDHEEITFRYCTEGMMTVVNDVDLKNLRQQLARLGDSIVVAGSKTRLRVHIHTDTPAKVFAILSRHGHIDFQKVDDMEFQHELLTKGPKAKIGLLIDSCADVPKSVRFKHQMHLVSLNLHVGKSQYLDRISITPNQFYRLLRKSDGKEKFSTSQPSKKDFSDKYNFMSTLYDSVISLSVSSRLSGTYQNSVESARRAAIDTGKRISAIDTKLCSGTEGLVAVLAAEAIEAGFSHDEVLDKIDKWILKSRLFVNTQSITGFIRSGRISKSKSVIANLLKLRPLITMDKAGNGEKIGNFKGQKKMIQRTLEIFREDHEKIGIDRYCVCYTDQSEIHKAEEVAERMHQICGKKADYITQLSPVLGSIGYNGAIEVAYVTK